MNPDPKFGWHVLWIVPLFWAGHYIGLVRDAYRRWRYHTRIAEIKQKNPDIEELSVLAGIKQRDKKQ